MVRKVDILRYDLNELVVFISFGTHSQLKNQSSGKKLKLENERLFSIKKYNISIETYIKYR